MASQYDIHLKTIIGFSKKFSIYFADTTQSLTIVRHSSDNFDKVGLLELMDPLATLHSKQFMP